jgi:CheY-like chemotaxis protein
VRDSRRIDILIADDNDPIRSGLAVLLPALAQARTPPVDLKVSCASDGMAALSLATESPPDLVLLDNAMPGMTGEAVIVELIRRKVPTRAIVFTGHSTSHSETISFVRHGASSVLHKPIDKAELLSAIVRAVEVDPTLRERFAEPALMMRILDEERAHALHEITQLKAEQEQANKRVKRLESVQRNDTLQRSIVGLTSVLTAALIAILLFSLEAITSGTQVILTICILSGFLLMPVARIKSFVARIFGSRAGAQFHE